MPEVINTQERNTPEVQELYIINMESMHEYPHDPRCYEGFVPGEGSISPLSVVGDTKAPN